MAVQKVRLLSPLANINRMDFALADVSLLDFENANPLEMGEWLTFDSAGKLVRAADPGVLPGPYMLFVEKGRSDTQGIAGGKAPILFQGGYWAETTLFTGTPVLGASLEVAEVTVGTMSKRGLQTATSGSVIGFVTKVATSNGGWLQFQQTLV
ncbi:MAG: hypothetical protein ACXAEU_17090 [Candidatus Hodarchaeales archaeon]|jgi:hypothetical protein